MDGPCDYGHFEIVVADFLKKKTYELYFYSGAMVNVFLQWQKNGKNITPEELAGIITDYRRIS